MSNPTISDYIAVKNTLSHYCIVLDSKAFDELHSVFLLDATADYPFNHNLQGVDAVSAAIRKRLGPIRTHHNLTTQTVTFDLDLRAAHAVTYFQGVHFGQGPHEGKMLCAYGKYEDDLVPLNAEGDVIEKGGAPEARSTWRIVRRKVEFTHRIGDERIMSEF